MGPLTIGEEYGGMLRFRAYLAAIIGPFRRPFGRASQLQLAVGAPQQVAQNLMSNKVLFVTASLRVGVQGFNFSQPGGGSQFSTPLPADFILYPGESLSMEAAVGAATVVITSEAF